MKSNFPGYFALSTNRIKRLWDEGIFVFDANILLGLYRYSDATRKEFLSTLEPIKERCWLPHQAVKEFFNNRLTVIGKQEDAYSEIVKSMDEMEGKFRNSHQHPFLSEKVLERLCNDFDMAKRELQKSRDFHTKRIHDDEVLGSLERVFRDRIGEAYQGEELKELIAEGEDRYAKNIPPGFRDGKKEDPSDETRKYGDLILWKQILDRAKTTNQGIIFVCDDRKDDWWLQFRGKTLGARPELVKEFKQATESDFHMYSSDRFLEFAGEHFDRQISSGAVTEMREMKRLDEERRRSRMIARKRIHEMEILSRQIEEKREALIYEMSRIDHEKMFLKEEREALASNIKIDDPAAISSSDFEKVEKIMMKIHQLEHREAMLRHEIEDLSNKKKIYHFEARKSQHDDGLND